MSGGANQNDDDQGGLISEINVTPLVDIMLVLLIIFMATASLISSPALRVDLPTGSSAKADAQDPDVVIVITREGELRYHDQVYSADKLIPELKREHDAKPQSRLLIVADQKAYHGAVVQVMDLAKTVGFARLAVAVNSGGGS